MTRHFDRGRFDAALAQGLAERDTPRYHAVFRRAQRSRDRWQLTLSADPSGIDSGFDFGNQPPGRLTARWVIDAGGRGVPFARCHGARLDRFSGEGWLAVGDAALSCDPLCAHGITTALVSGRDGARAVLGGSPAVAAYEQRLAAVYQDYLSQLRSFYLAEGRWPASTYWQARRRALS